MSFEKIGGFPRQEHLKKRDKVHHLHQHITEGRTPREKQFLKERREMQRANREALKKLSETSEISKREMINTLRKVVQNAGNISENPTAIRAYQTLIFLTNPRRFFEKIQTIDGIYGDLTEAAYKEDEVTLKQSGHQLWETLFGGAKKKKKKVIHTQATTQQIPENIGGRTGSIKSAPSQRSESGITLCSRTALNNLHKFVPGGPSGNANNIYSEYSTGRRPENMLSFKHGDFSPPEDANVVDILLDTPQKKNYRADYGHRAIAYKEKGNWYVLDPYYGGRGQEPMPIKEYLARFHRPGYGVRGIAYYKSNTLDNRVA